VFNKWVTPAKIAASVFFPPYAIYLGAKAISMRVYNKKGKCGVFNEKKLLLNAVIELDLKQMKQDAWSLLQLQHMQKVQPIHKI